MSFAFGNEPCKFAAVYFCRHGLQAVPIEATWRDAFLIMQELQSLEMYQPLHCFFSFHRH